MHRRTPHVNEACLRELRRTCENLLDAQGIVIPSPFDRHALAQAVAARRGRPIELRVLPVPVAGNEFSGYWVATPLRDLIFIDPTRSPWEQDHVTAHEIGHILWGHQASDVDLGDVVLPDLDMSVVRAMLGRHDFTTDQERAAEMMATVIIERSGRTAPDAAPGLSRVASALAADDV